MSGRGGKGSGKKKGGPGRSKHSQPTAPSGNNHVFAPDTPVRILTTKPSAEKNNGAVGSAANASVVASPKVEQFSAIRIMQLGDNGFVHGFDRALNGILSDGNQFMVIGAVGRVSSGKSFILNAVHAAGEYRNTVASDADEKQPSSSPSGFRRVFSETIDAQLVECSACTTVVEVCVNSAHRTITVDTWPVFYSQEFDDVKSIVRQLAFMLCICDVLCVVMDRVLDWNLWSSLRSAQMLLRLITSSPTPVQKGVKAGKLLFVFNKYPNGNIGNVVSSSELLKDMFPGCDSVLVSLDENRSSVGQKLTKKLIQMTCRESRETALTEKTWVKEISLIWETLQSFPLPE
eukprot:TRINITY_DN2515_c0_g1_i1.p1 TRINITY_DN2515_c0_g1~~TRINITY_DN2515_c0_g1_i1.p1  ORF type:complete len:346 (+),score=100.05 TRINITY_DN2515_c0_g1_i1:31-1068(+)